MDRQTADVAIFMQIPAVRRLNALNYTHVQTPIFPSSKFDHLCTQTLADNIFQLLTLLSVVSEPLVYETALK